MDSSALEGKFEGKWEQSRARDDEKSGSFEPPRDDLRLDAVYAGEGADALGEVPMQVGGVGAASSSTTVTRSSA